MRFLKYYALIVLGAAAWLEAQGTLAGSASYTLLIGATIVGILWYLIAKTLDQKTPFSTPNSQELLQRMEQQIELKRLQELSRAEISPSPLLSPPINAPPQKTSLETKPAPNTPLPERRRGLGYLGDAPPTNPGE